MRFGESQRGADRNSMPTPVKTAPIVISSDFNSLSLTPTCFAPAFALHVEKQQNRWRGKLSGQGSTVFGFLEEFVLGRESGRWATRPSGRRGSAQ
jgi:hypothetical protein